jgi:hypothetical protein
MEGTSLNVAVAEAEGEVGGKGSSQQVKEGPSVAQDSSVS